MNIVIVGGGFAGVWAALSAAVTLEKAATGNTPITIRLISDQTHLTIRPRLYETPNRSMLFPLQPLLNVVDVALISGQVSFIDAQKQQVHIAEGTEEANLATKILPFDQLIVATGSKLHFPQGLGLAQSDACGNDTIWSDKVFSMDTYREAMRFERYLQAMPSQQNLPFVILGGGLTGIEIATELRTRLTQQGKDNDIVLVDAHHQIGNGLGSALQPPIAAALQAARVSTASNTRAVKLEGNALELTSEGMASSMRIAALILASGLRANLPKNNFARVLSTATQPDQYGRLPVNRYLQMPDLQNVLLAGDTAKALAHEEHASQAEPGYQAGNRAHYTYMSCQHAIPMGLVAGRNAALACLQQPAVPFQQSAYATCIDLGEAGALFSTGWQRRIQSQGNEAKRLKHEINRVWISPPSPDVGKAGIMAFVEQGWQQIQ